MLYLSALTPHLNDLLERAEDGDTQENQAPIQKDALEKTHQHLWAEARDKHRERTQALANYRRESLLTSRQKRICCLRIGLHKRLIQTFNGCDKVNLSSAEADYRRRIQEFDEAMAKADITAEPVAYGILEVESGT